MLALIPELGLSFGANPYILVNPYFFFWTFAFEKLM